MKKLCLSVSRRLRPPGWRVATWLLVTGMSMAACSGSPVSPTKPTESAAIEGSPATSPSPPPSSSSSLENQVLVLVNRQRASGATCGGTARPAVAPLTLNLQLRDAARGHSQDMATKNYFSHTSLDGRTFAQRIVQAGYAGRSPLSETIGAGASTAEAVVDAWMRDTSHCLIIMDSGLRVVGIGYAFNQSSTYSRYWTQDFGGG